MLSGQKSLSELFPNLEKGLYEEMMKFGEIKKIPAGTVMLRSGQTIRSIIMVLEGAVKLYQEDDDGNQFFIYNIQPGQACAVSMVCTYAQEKSQVKQLGKHVKLTHQDIATDLNSSREVISRLMKKMEKDGWITIHRNSFEWIKDM